MYKRRMRPRGIRAFDVRRIMAWRLLVFGKQSVERWLTGKSRDSPEWNWAISMVTAASLEGIESAAKVHFDNDDTITMRRTRLLASMW